MYLRQLSQAHLFIPLFSVLILLFLSINHVDAEGVLPLRQRHRAQALIAARRHYKRQFANDTIDATTSSDRTSSSSLLDPADSTTSSLSSIGSFNDTGSSIPATTGTATGVLGPPAFVGGTTSDSDLTTSVLAVASSTSVSALTTSTIFGPIEDDGTTGPATVSTSSTSTVAGSSAATTQSSSDTSVATSQTTNAFAAVTNTDIEAASSTVLNTESTTVAGNSVGTDSSTVQSDSVSQTAVIAGTETGTSVQSATFTPTPSAPSVVTNAPTVTDAPTTVSNTDVVSTTGPPAQQFTSATTSGDSVVPTITTGGFPVTTTGNTVVPTTIEPTTTGGSSIPEVTDTSIPTGTTTQGSVIATGVVTSSEDTATGTRTSDAFFATDTSDSSIPSPTVSQLANGTTVNPDVIPTSSISTSSETAWLPTALITQAPSPSTSSNLVTAADPTPTIQPTGAPSVPKIVTPADGIPENPPNSTLVRIGFLESLNYPFVVQHSVTVAQIFQVLPIAIAYGLQIPTSLVTTRSLQPYPLSDYTATVAMVWIPQDQYDTLRVSILAVNSRLYSQVDPTAEQLVKLIDPTIPLMADGSTTADSPGGTSGTPNSQDNANTNSQGATDGSLDNIGSQNPSTTTSSTGKQVAIGMGAAAAAIGYAALMFFGAKRFRKQSVQIQNDRRVGHQRVSSVTGEPASPPFAAPRSYRSSGTSSNRNVRGANISAPLMTENSLLL